MSRKSHQSHSHVETSRTMPYFVVDPTECPFREFRDNELSADYWGLGPAACRAAVLMSGKIPKPPHDYVWVDDQTQPLPRSVRQYLHGWVRAEQLALSRWEADVVVFEENNFARMSVMDTQLSHAQVLMRSMFCRRVLSACFILERVEGLPVEHQWENFVFSFGPEGWRAKYHIYSPGMKAGGGPQHRPGLSKNGCYLVRLYYLGAWRCVWVSDQIPVDATEAPLLPFSPLLSRAPSKPGVKAAPATVTANVVYLWPLLLCKALLKLAAPDMSSDEDTDCVEDEQMHEFDIMHSLTGYMNVTYHINELEDLWRLIINTIPVFTWDDDDDTLASTVKSKSTKKPTTKEAVILRSSMATVVIEDTKHLQPYVLPGITPGHEMSLLVTMARDLPIKKPLPEPDVASWKRFRWVDWARRHGLYEAYECPRTKYLRVNGLMKLSYAPHLLDVSSTESITFGFRQAHDVTDPPPVGQKKGGKGDATRSQTAAVSTRATPSNIAQVKEELREWIQYESLQVLLKHINIIYFPCQYELTTATSSPPQRAKVTNRALDILAPKFAPLYLQIDGPLENKLKISLSTLHPRILINSGIPIEDHIDPAYLFLEKFDWFKDCEVPIAKGFVQTRGYDSIEVTFPPGRHYCRLWVHSRMNWHAMLMSESTLLLGTRDVIQSASIRECPWAAKFLSNLSIGFTNWIRVSRSYTVILSLDKEFYNSYKPDLEWEPDAVGYNQSFVHWMFRQALQSTLYKKLSNTDFHSVCKVLRHYFCDPDFGLPPKAEPSKPLREIVALDPCDCLVIEGEEAAGETEECLEEQIMTEERPLVKQAIMSKLLAKPVDPIISQVCENATDELPCGILKIEREKFLRRHEAATVIQAYWRGTRTRKCLENKVSFTPDVLKHVMESAFGNLEALSALMNEFFRMFPGAKSAYSISSALSGTTSLQQHHGTAAVTSKCKWVPYFQGLFYCHAPVKVHFDIQSSLQHSTMMVFNNDTEEQMPQAFNAHITFDFSPNNNGYTVVGHGSLSETLKSNSDAHWQLTVLSSLQGAFHVCDNDSDGCKELPMQGCYKLHIDEIFVPNRRNILGGLLISVTKHEAISFRAATTSPELEIVATLRTTSSQGEVEELGHCSGKGEIFWPFIQLKPLPLPEVITNTKKRSVSHANLTLTEGSGGVSTRSLPKSQTKGNKVTSSAKNKSNIKIKPLSIEAKLYTIEVTAPAGWPLTLAQWMRVDEVRNSTEFIKIEAPKKPAKPISAKEKDKTVSPAYYTPQLNDAFTELECSLTSGGGGSAGRDDTRDLEFAAARKSWEAKEPGRNTKCAQARNEFRAEFLESLSGPPSESVRTSADETIREETGSEVDSRSQAPLPQGPTPVTESGSSDQFNIPNQILVDHNYCNSEPVTEKKKQCCPSPSTSCGENKTIKTTQKRKIVSIDQGPSTSSWENKIIKTTQQRKKNCINQASDQHNQILLDHNYCISESITEKERPCSPSKCSTVETDVAEATVPCHVLEMTTETEEETKYLSIPEQLKDKFIPLYFLPFCLKEKNDDECVLVTNDMAEAAKQDRHARNEAGLERMKELQEYNQNYVLQRQRRRCQLLENLLIDSQLSPNLAAAFNERDDAIAQEMLTRQISANKKKQETKTGRK